MNLVTEVEPWAQLVELLVGFLANQVNLGLELKCLTGLTLHHL